METQAHGEKGTHIPVTIFKTPARTTPARTASRKLIRRTDRDYSQILRRSFQAAFLLLNFWIGTQFYYWVRQFEPGGAATSLRRPAGVEGWLPIAGLMNLKYFVLTHRIPALHPAGLFLLLAFLGISLLFRKAFCSWLCPVGTISEYLWKLGRKLFRKNLLLPRWLDLGLRSLKYVLLAFFVWAVGSMGAAEIAAFMQSPYGVIADVKMLNFFRFMSLTTAIVIGILLTASIFIQNFWCRYLCPYGALLGITSLFSPAWIRRNPSTCIDCAKCAKACPSVLPVDKRVTIRSAECTGCLECVAVCPARDALSLSLPIIPVFAPNRSKLPVWAMAAGIAAIFLGMVGFAKTAGYWDSQVSRDSYQQVVPHANEARHPMPGED